MDSDSIRKVIAIVILIVLSAFFSAAEAAFSSMNRGRIKNLASNGDKKADLIMKLADDSDRLFCTILIIRYALNMLTVRSGNADFYEAIKTQAGGCCGGRGGVYCCVDSF
jgi:CBS domain containing-hemolysin-like protein